jgi:hypothetical protein
MKLTDAEQLPTQGFTDKDFFCSRDPSPAAQDDGLALSLPAS